MSDQLYKNYEEWKSWDPSQFLRTSLQDEAYYSGELAGIDLKGSRVLELGFGNGSFLGFARAHGAEVYGTEILEPALNSARAAGVNLLPSDLELSSKAYEGDFDLIAAFDVLEHLTVSQINDVLDNVSKMLRIGGVFIARFPNEQSPLGRVWQHGDYTHRSTLSASVIRQLIVARPFEIVRNGDQFREYSGGPMRKLVGFIRYRLQDMLFWLTRRLFRFNANLGLNTVVVLCRV